MSFFAVNNLVLLQTQKKLDTAKKAKGDVDDSKKKKRVKKVRKSGGSKHGSDGSLPQSDVSSLSSAATGLTTSQFSHKLLDRSMVLTPGSVELEDPIPKDSLPRRLETQFEGSFEGSITEEQEEIQAANAREVQAQGAKAEEKRKAEPLPKQPKVEPVKQEIPLEAQLIRAVESSSNPVGLIYKPKKEVPVIHQPIPGTSQGLMYWTKPQPTQPTPASTPRRNSTASSIQTTSKRSAATRLSHKLSSTFLSSKKSTASSSIKSGTSTASPVIPVASHSSTRPAIRSSSTGSTNSISEYSLHSVAPAVAAVSSPISQLLKKEAQYPLEQTRSNSLEQVRSNSLEQGSDSIEQTRSPLSEQRNPKAESVVPAFQPMFNLSLLNETETLEKNVTSSHYHIFRYNNFLEILSDHHHTDAVNFALLRLHSLFKVITRIGELGELIKWLQTREHSDVRFYESILASVLFSFRKILRKVMRESQVDQNHTAAVVGEEMLQVNFTNYIRYIIRLPPLTPDQRKYLTEDELTHYKNRSLLDKISHSLYRIKLEETGDSNDTASENSAVTRIGLVIQSITKVCNEFFILEKYHLHILAKMNQDSLIEKRILKTLFQTYKDNIKKGNSELPKVLFYNTFYSAQYSWYLSITSPFVRVFEANVCAERADTPWNDLEKYAALAASSPQTSFEESDRELYDNYLTKLHFDDFEQFRETLPKKLVKLQRMLDNQLNKYKNIKKHEVPDPLTVFSFKPMNFEHYSKPLYTIPSNLFNLVHFRDPVLQLTQENQRAVLKEFKRILKPGASLEMPLINLGNDGIKRHFDSKYKGGVAKGWGFMEHSLNQHVKFIPNLVENLILDVKSVFGNVQYSVVLVKLSNEVNTFWLTHCSLLIYDMSGQIENFWGNIGVDKRPDIYYYFHIKALKK